MAVKDEESHFRRFFKNVAIKQTNALPSAENDP